MVYFFITLPGKVYGCADDALDRMGAPDSPVARAHNSTFIHSHAVHRGLPNLSGRYMRISTDNRCQSAHDEIDPSSLLLHLNLDVED